MFGWRASKELEFMFTQFMFTLNAIAWGLVVLALTVSGSTLPDWTVVGLIGLALALALADFLHASSQTSQPRDPWSIDHALDSLPMVSKTVGLRFAFCFGASMADFPNRPRLGDLAFRVLYGKQ